MAILDMREKQLAMSKIAIKCLLNLYIVSRLHIYTLIPSCYLYYCPRVSYGSPRCERKTAKHVHVRAIHLYLPIATNGKVRVRLFVSLSKSCSVWWMTKCFYFVSVLHVLVLKLLPFFFFANDTYRLDRGNWPLSAIHKEWCRKCRM